MNTIANRLRGKYPLGPFQANGEPEFGWRQFDIDDLPEELMTRPSAIMREAASYIERLEEVLKAYEAWEADLLLNGNWSQGTVHLRQEQQDRLIEIQHMRNAALRQNNDMKEG